MIKEYFKTYQKDLLWIANTDAGKYLLEAGEDEKIVKIYPNGYRVWNGIKQGIPMAISRFRTWDVVAVTLGPLLEKIRIANEHKEIDQYKALLHYAGFYRGNFPSIHLAVNTFTANGGGQGRIVSMNATYATAQSATSGTKDNLTPRPGNFVSGDYFVNRGFAPFDTAALPSGPGIIVSASTFIRCVGTVSVNDADSDSVSVVASTQASDTALVDGDFDQVGTTKFATDKTFASYNASGNNDFPLNASGIANISDSGYSKFAWRTAKDIAATQPTGLTYVEMVDNTNLLSVEHSLVGDDSYAEFI